MKLTGIKQITGKIVLKSGLHIGAGDMEMHIGGTDNPVIKHPHTMEPYIPGSSIKGKVRSLLELKSGLMVKTKGSPVSARTMEGLEGEALKECRNILKLFGTSGADADAMADLGPTRVSFADCSLDEDWKQKAIANHWPLTEVKSENTIDRVTGTAQNPRFTERVPAGTVFRFSVSLKQLDDDAQLLDLLLEGLSLLQLDSLGGSGSRGYGRIDLEFDESEIQRKFSEALPLMQEG
ncbi:MAG: type III-A CRISPR-associated RAMP protein Csm3 [Desulfobacterium sp.]|nr:type III-A CRISPR-associated RAMP protein Csm3 [Desulfobacterium sp.]